jgi:leader peptidase (prepilin peptidase)/N-methyltransferase
MNYKLYIMITIPLSAAAAAAIFFEYGLSVQSVLFSAAAAVLAAIAIEDAMTKEIHDVLLWGLLLIAAAACLAGSFDGAVRWQQHIGIGGRIAGASCLSILMIIVNIVTRRLSGRDSFGSGDIILCIAAGFLLGVEKTLAAGALSFIAAGFFAAFILVSGRAKKDDSFALGPFLCAAFIFELICKSHILQ